MNPLCNTKTAQSEPKTDRRRKQIMEVGAVLGFVAMGACSDISPYFAVRTQPEKINAEIEQRFLLIGDAGEDQMHEPVLTSLEPRAGWLPNHTTIIFPAAKIYEPDIPPPPVPNTPD